MKPGLPALAIFTAALAATGCRRQSPQPVVLDASGITPAAVSYGDLAAVLSDVVSGRGMLYADAARKNAPRLDLQLKLMAVSGPASTPRLFPTPDDRLAYWLNARTAWSIKLAMLADFPKERIGSGDFRRPFPLDGRSFTLSAIDLELSADGDWRAAVVAPCVCLDRAGLPDRPFLAADVRVRLDEALNDFVANDARFVIDIAARRIRVPPAMWKVRDGLIRRYEAAYGTSGAALSTAMLPYLRGKALLRIQNAIGFECVQAAPGMKLGLVEE